MALIPASTPPDEALRLLVGRAAKGDRASARAVLERVGPPVRRVVRTVLGPRASNGSNADDVTQEALVGVIHALGSFRGECGFVHYACRIATRVAMAARRSRGMEIDIERLDSDEHEVPGDDPEAPHRRAIVRALVDALPEAQGETLVLKVMLGYSLTEVAETMGVPVNTVRSRLRLAKDALRNRIVEDAALVELLEVG